MEGLNDWFNGIMDIALVVATRLGELPSLLVMLFATVFVSALFVYKFLAQKFRGRSEPLRSRYLRSLLYTLGVCAVLHMAQRTELLLRESREILYYARRNAVMHMANQGEAEFTEAQAASTQALIDVEAARRGLPLILGSAVDLSSRPLANGIEFACFHSLGPRPVTGYVSVVDLTQPDIEIEITEEFTSKSLTSEFADERGCVVAINGEAGLSPARDAPLASYSGWWIVNGNSININHRFQRPFLGFNQQNHGQYFGSFCSKNETSKGVYNALWGRGDLLLDGEFPGESNHRWFQPSPRTLMGLNQAGTQLVLAVIDGRQLGYSVGADLETAASLMKLFGAYNAMWCDQGGSTTMFLGGLSAVINRPSDGKERPVYTHFGVCVR